MRLFYREEKKPLYPDTKKNQNLAFKADINSTLAIYIFSNTVNINNIHENSSEESKKLISLLHRSQ